MNPSELCFKKLMCLVPSYMFNSVKRGDLRILCVLANYAHAHIRNSGTCSGQSRTCSGLAVTKQEKPTDLRVYLHMQLLKL